jgi:hypothetical protein
VSGAKVYTVKSRLSELALGQGGSQAEDAIRRAEVEVEKTFPRALQVLDQLLTQLDACHAAEMAVPGRPSPAEYARFYACSSQMIDASICLPDSMFDAAARALCDLVDLSAELEVWDDEAVTVHIRALRLLRVAGPEMELTTRRKLVESLYQVTRKRVGDRDQLANVIAADAANPQAA